MLDPHFLATKLGKAAVASIAATCLLILAGPMIGAPAPTPPGLAALTNGSA